MKLNQGDCKIHVNSNCVYYAVDYPKVLCVTRTIYNKVERLRYINMVTLCFTIVYDLSTFSSQLLAQGLRILLSNLQRTRTGTNAKGLD